MSERLITVRSQISHERSLREMRFVWMVAIQQTDCELVMVTIEGAGKVDFYSRVWSPWHGVGEDPVTGSAYTVLTPFWNKVRKDVFDEAGVGPYLNARQASDRDGDLRCRVVGDRVEISGKAVTYLTGEIFVP